MTTKKSSKSVKKEEKKEYIFTNMRLTKKEHESVKKATVDFKVGFRDIMLAGVQAIKSGAPCTSKKVSSKK